MDVNCVSRRSYIVKNETIRITKSQEDANDYGSTTLMFALPSKITSRVRNDWSWESID